MSNQQDKTSNAQKAPKDNTLLNKLLKANENQERKQPKAEDLQQHQQHQDRPFQWQQQATSNYQQQLPQQPQQQQSMPQQQQFPQQQYQPLPQQPQQWSQQQQQQSLLQQYQLLSQQQLSQQQQQQLPTYAQLQPRRAETQPDLPPLPSYPQQYFMQAGRRPDEYSSQTAFGSSNNQNIPQMSSQPRSNFLNYEDNEPIRLQQQTFSDFIQTRARTQQQSQQTQQQKQPLQIPQPPPLRLPQQQLPPPPGLRILNEQPPQSSLTSLKQDNLQQISSKLRSSYIATGIARSKSHQKQQQQEEKRPQNQYLKQQQWRNDDFQLKSTKSKAEKFQQLQQKYQKKKQQLPKPQPKSSQLPKVVKEGGLSSKKKDLKEQQNLSKTNLSLDQASNESAQDLLQEQDEEECREYCMSSSKVCSDDEIESPSDESSIMFGQQDEQPEQLHQRNFPDYCIESKQSDDQESKKRLSSKSIERTRERTEKKVISKNAKGKQQLSYASKELSQASSYPKRRRQMADIQTGSLNTSHSITKESFKWNSIANQHIFQKAEKAKKKQFKDPFAGSGMELEEDDEAANEFSLLDRDDQEDITAKKGKYNFYNSKIIEEKKQLSESENNVLLRLFNKLNIQDKDSVLKTAQAFAQTMDILIQEQESLRPIIKMEDLLYCQNIGKGSFGKVDLYLLNISNSFNEMMSSSLSQSPYNSGFTSQTKTSSKGLMMSSSSGQYPFQMQLSASKNIFSLEKVESIDLSQPTPPNAYSLSSQKQSNVFSTGTNSQIQKTQNIPLCGLPIAAKKIENIDEYTRELYIVQLIKGEFIPTLFHADLDNQLLFMEVGLASLEDIKTHSNQSGQPLSDAFTYAVLLNLIKAIEQLLKNKDKNTNQPLPLFHSDIKPSNVMLSVKQNAKQKDFCQVKLLLIDYGGASFSQADYWSYYTPAFVCPTLWSKLVVEENLGTQLSWEEIHYAEIYAACRSVMFLIVEADRKDQFNKENIVQFYKAYSFKYPRTCSIFRKVFEKERICEIPYFFFGNTFPAEVASFLNNNCQIPFETKELFSLSSIYSYYSQKQSEVKEVHRQETKGSTQKGRIIKV